MVVVLLVMMVVLEGLVATSLVVDRSRDCNGLIWGWFNRTMNICISTGHREIKAFLCSMLCITLSFCTKKK